MRLSFPKPAIVLPARLQRPTVTVNVEEQVIRTLAVRGSSVVSWEEALLEAGVVRDGIIADPERAGEALAAALDSQGLAGGNLVACVTGFRSIARVLELPKMAPDLLEEAITREAKREMPVPMEDVHLSWQTLDADDGTQRVFSLAVPRDVLDPLLKMMTVAKRHPSAVDIKPLALARVCGEEEAIIGDVERSSADMIVVTKGIPVIMRTVIDRGGESGDEARIARFRDELARTIKFYNDTHRQEPLDPSTPIFLTGPLAEMVTAAEPLQSLEALELYSVRALSPPLAYPPELPVHTYAVNLGLALKEV
ncbi:MAG: pilus assembly protein PilM [Dehalococcoidia bacterium]|jgi:type IV pilus assembly protein PilM